MVSVVRHDRQSKRRRAPLGLDFARGVTLVDLLVGVVMLGVSVVVLMGLSAQAISAQRSGENLEAAAMILDQQLNLVLARGGDNYASRFDDSEGRGETPYERFRYKVDVAAGSGGSAGEAYAVTATVWWMEGGRERSASVETRVAPRLGEQPDPDRRPVDKVDRLGGVP